MGLSVWSFREKYLNELLTGELYKIFRCLFVYKMLLPKNQLIYTKFIKSEAYFMFILLLKYFTLFSGKWI